jgi:hypothetical protein
MPPARTMTPTGGPTLPRLQTSQSSGYIPYSAGRSMTPASSSIPPSATIRSVTDPVRAYTPFGQQPQGLPNGPRGGSAPYRQASQDTNDILDHY